MGKKWTSHIMSGENLSQCYNFFWTSHITKGGKIVGTLWKQKLNFPHYDGKKITKTLWKKIWTSYIMKKNTTWHYEKKI